MSNKIIEVFNDCLKSDLSCDEIYEKIQKLSQYKINKSIVEEDIFNLFFKSMTRSRDFLDALNKFSNEYNFTLSHKNVFGVCNLIVNNERKYKSNEFYKNIVLFYKTYYFFEIAEDNKSNDFTFYVTMPDGSKLPKEFEIYLFNIGSAILKKESDSMFLKILFSEDTPLYLSNIIMICFLYTRYKNKKVSDFVELCVPFLNHYNLFYLHELINKEFNYQFKYKDEIIYYNFENFLKNLNVPNVESISSYEESKENIINIIKDKNENIISSNIDKEAIAKYFNLADEDDKVKEFFTNKNLENNKKNFFEFKNPKFQKQYKLVYDKSEINDKTINAFSFPYLLKNNLISAIDEHFFQIYNAGNIKIEIFSNILSKYMASINNLLSGSISEEDKTELLLNSGLCKYNNDYLLLMKIKEDDEKMFYLKNGLCNTKITSLNNDKNFEVYQVIQSQKSTAIYTSENELYSNKDIVEERLYTFGNYSYENDLRTYIKNFISNNKEVYELPRLYMLLNYCIPIEKDKFQFIINVKKVIENSSYGYGEMDFVLKNDSQSDIVLENEDMPYKEKIYMTFPRIGDKKEYNQKIILKKNSIIFFEFKSAFPQFKWREKFSHLFKKVEKFIKIYQNRGLSYNNECIQIYLIYDNIPDLYNIKSMKSYINQQFSKLFEKFEFGLYYFSKGITIINNQILEKRLKNNLKKELENKLKKELENNLKKELEKKMDDLYNIFKLIKDENVQKELQKVFEKK